MWNEVANENGLWKNLCLKSKWKFSALSEKKQIARCTHTNNYIDVSNIIFYTKNIYFGIKNSYSLLLILKWKSVFAERYRIKSNWLSGRSHVKTFYGHDGAISCVQFDDIRIVAGSTDGSIK